MRLKSLRVADYKVIDDTDTVPVDARVTSLVGRNESGKTAILRALWKSRNVAGARFDKLLDFPSARYSRQRKESQRVTSLGFALSEAEAKELASQFPFPLDEPPGVLALDTSYAGEEKTVSAIVFEPRIEEKCRRPGTVARTAVEAVDVVLGKHMAAGESALSTAVKTALAAFNDAQPLWHSSNREGLVAFKGALDTWIGGAPERATYASQERRAIEELCTEAQRGDPSTKAREWAGKKIPSFIYFDDYGQLETRIHLPTYLKQSRETPIPPKVRTQRALFQWSKVDPEEILQLGRPKEDAETDDAVQRRLLKRSTLLDSASFHLTGEWADWWLPDTKHQLHMSADGDYLVLKVSDASDPFKIPFEERSQGFQWFFSFYLVFLVESAEAHQDAILLLDEPGLHLHPTMQSKLVGFFERVAEKNQVVYSTHLPFLVDGDRLDRVRTVYRSKETPPKTVVSTDVRGGGDRDTLFPLQAAIGYSIAQTLFLGTRSVVVEGITDFVLLKALNAVLASKGMDQRLHPDTVLVPAGGTSKLMPLASLMFATSGVAGKRMLVLLDSDTEGERAGKSLNDALFGAESRVLLLGEAIGLPAATVEDIMTRAEYLTAVKSALGREVVLDSSEEAEPLLVTALAKHWTRMGWGKFGLEEKGRTAFHLVATWTTPGSTITEDTLSRARALFAAINGRF